MNEYRIGVHWLLDWRQHPRSWEEMGIQPSRGRMYAQIDENKVPKVYRQIKQLVETNEEKTLNNSLKADDLFEPSPRIKSEVTRIVRDTALTQFLKKLHKYKCQLCDLVIQLPDGSMYNEAHHIKPLGRGHYGPDVAKNIIVVCPNHHEMLDFGAIKLTIGDISPGHEIGPEFIEYHNTLIYKGTS
jgi:predicted HNH restriction endonuclease